MLQAISEGFCALTGEVQQVRAAIREITAIVMFICVKLLYFKNKKDRSKKEEQLKQEAGVKEMYKD